MRSQIPQKAGASTEQLSGVEETVIRLSGQVSTLTRQQKYFRTRENRNFSTVRSTEKRIFNFSLIESGLMVAMAGLQVFVVKMFFTGGRKGECFDARWQSVNACMADLRFFQDMCDVFWHEYGSIYNNSETPPLHVPNRLKLSIPAACAFHACDMLLVQEKLVPRFNRSAQSTSRPVARLCHGISNEIDINSMLNE